MSGTFSAECSAETAAFFEKFLPETAERTEFFRKVRIIGEELYETNKVMNLTRIPETEFWTKHAADSLALAGAADLRRENLTLCDVGCGAGFPSLILAAAFPDLRVTAVDSTGKKIDFVRRTAEKAGIGNLTAIHVRAHELAGKPEHHWKYDLVTARAVSDAVPLHSECAALLRKEGLLYVYRTPVQLERELADLQRLHPDFRLSKAFELPENAGTRLFLILSSARPRKGKK